MMSEKRYEYCDEIAAIVDMSKTTIEGGEEMTTSDVVDRLNQLEEDKERMMKLAHEYITAYEKLAFGDTLLTAEETK